MNWNRIFLGGLAGGVVMFVLEGVAGFLVSAKIYISMLQRLNLTMPASSLAWVWDVAVSLMFGLLIAALYAAMRPRFGAGPKTAIYAAIAAWLPLNFVGTGYQVDLGMMPLRDGIVLSAQSLVICVVVGLVCGALYREKPASLAAAA